MRAQAAPVAPPQAVAVPTPTPVPAPAGIVVESTTVNAFDPLAGFSFGGPVAQAKRKGSKTEYPVVPDPTGELSRIAGQYKLDKEQAESLKGTLESGRDALIAGTRKFYFDRFHGIAEPESSVAISTSEGEVLVTFPESFTIAPSPKDVVAVIGADAARQLFRPAFELKVKSDELPEGPQTQALLNELMAVFAKHGASSAVSFKQSIKPRKGFNLVRHTRFDVATNLAMDKVCSIVPRIVTKGRE